MTMIRAAFGFAVVALIATATTSTRISGQSTSAKAPADKAATKTADAPSATSDTYREVYQGWKWWHVYCYRCHGVDALGTTTAPNLTDPNEKFTRAEFMKIVRTGKPDTAMQAWNKLLDDKQIAQVYVYVRARADKVLPPGRPDEVGPNGGPWEPPASWRAR